MEAQVAVSGDRRLDSLLVCLDPSVDIVEPSEYRERQLVHAARLLEGYDG